MKKVLAFSLTTMMVLGLTACTPKAETPTDEGNQAQTATQTQTQDPAAPAADPAPASTPSTSFSFSGYTETGDWPNADTWAGYGLPDLALSEDVSGTVHISDKSWIYPLNGTDGTMFDAWPATSQFDNIVAALEGAGIVGEGYDDGDKKEYTAYYDNGGTPMKLYMSELVYSGKLSILVVANPTD